MTPDGPPLLVLLNPAAGDGRAARRLRAALGRAPSLAARASVTAAGTVDEAKRALESLPPGAIAVAAGGDGTVRTVAAALRDLGGERTLAVLPLGTGNAAAHALGVGSVAAAVEAILQARKGLIDALLTDRPSAPLALCSISAGFEGDLLDALARGRTRGSPVVAALLELPRAMRRRGGLALEVDGAALLDPSERAFNAGLYALPRYAFGLRVHPDARADDGRAEAVVHLRAGTWLRGLALGVRTAGPSGPGCRTGRVARAVLESPGPIQLDGEAIGVGRIEVRVEPAAIRAVLGPGAAASPRRS